MLKDHKVTELEAEKSCLLDENIQLEEDIDHKKKAIDTSSDTINSFIYNIWKHKGLSWSEEYDEWMLMIKRHSVREARFHAREMGRDFDEEFHLLNKFTEDEREAINRVILAKEATASSMSWSGAAQASETAVVDDDEEEVDTKEVEEQDSPVPQYLVLPPLQQEQEDEVSPTEELTKGIEAGTTSAPIITGTNEAPTTQTLVALSIASAGDVTPTDPLAAQVSVVQGETTVIDVEDDTFKGLRDLSQQPISPYRGCLLTIDQAVTIKEQIEKNQEDK